MLSRFLSLHFGVQITILVVDDSTISCKLAMRKLKLLGCDAVRYLIEESSHSNDFYVC